jgi:hypothetical protein
MKTMNKIAMTALALIFAVVSNARTADKGVIPPGASFRGHTYGEWGVIWWQAAFALPVVGGDHPLISGGAFGGDQNVVFLSGVPGPVTKNITIRLGTAIFFPILNTECSVLEPDPFHGVDAASLIACANLVMDNTAGMSASIDGVPVPNLGAYRVPSLPFEYGPLPANNLLAVAYGDPVTFAAGATSLAADAGVYLMLAPLTVGHHTIHLTGTEVSVGFTADTTYEITVAR